MPEVIGVSSPVRAIMRKELRESGWKLWLGVGVLAALGASLGPMFGFLGDLMSPQILELLPGWLRGPMDPMLKDYRIYLWANWYGKNLYQMLTMFTVIFGAGVVAGEMSHRTSGFLHSKPVSRAAVLCAKYVVALGVLWLGALAGTAAALIGSHVAGHQVAAGQFLLGLPAALAATALLLAVVLLASVSTREPMKAAGLATLWLMALSVSTFVRPLRPYSVFVRMAGGRTLVTGRIEWVAILVMLVAAAVVVAITVRLFEQKEL
jgi:ABC-2 type transport system permease protein